MRPTLLQPTFFCLATLIAVLPLARASDSHRRSLHHNNLRHRRLQQRALPAGWTSLGCYSDNVNGRALTAASYTSATDMTVENCVNYCNGQNFIYAGIEYAQECYCGDVITDGSTSVASSDCSFACTGNPSETCGAGNRLNMYTSGATPPPPPEAVPSVGQYKSLGCYTDNVNGQRALQAASYTSNTAMTVESCVAYCSASNYIYAGVEYASQCFCGNTITQGSTGVTLSECNMLCTGNSSEYCGAGNLLNMYSNGATPPPPPQIVPSVGPWVSLGCYTDGNPRALSVGTTPVGGAANNSPASCTAACQAAGYTLAGVEYADECYCANSIGSNGAPAPASSCNMLCSGNSSEYCGGPLLLNVYNYTGTGSTTTTTTTSTSTGPTSTPSNVPTDLPTGWKYGGCWEDNVNGGRVFQNQNPDNQALTIESCVQSCASQGFTLAGAEFSVQCFCGDNLVEGSVIAPNTDCSMPCGGNAAESCGGPNRLSVYTSTGNVTALPVPTVQTTNLPGSWQYSQCFAEPPGGRVFPLYQIDLVNNNSATNCLSLCAEFGYPAAGMEYSDQCFCGDLSDITNNGGTPAPASDCSMPCSGDPIHICGGGSRLSLYTWNGPLTNWKTPTNIGYYEYVMPGLVPPLLATVGINGKVSFLEKSGTSEYPNSTGAYELDLSLMPNLNTAWREMHLKTDVFCSAAVVLPDKAARILNVGGWAEDSVYGIRLYAPDGSPGVNGTNDWEENPDDLELLTARWYPSAMVMSNGSVLVIGGEVGSNSAPSPTLEILPHVPGAGTLFMDWLNRTDPNNLYPFMNIMPSGKILAVYYNEARLLDPVTFNTVTVLPNLPGSVTSAFAGRSYPLEGAAVLLPMSAPYTQPAAMLVCGGSNFGIALDNCVSIQPEVANQNWTIERMPSQRVMPCMAPLPDGTYLIVNGGKAGVAGFGLGANPNFQALLYDPTQPVGSRFSILNTTTIARMYHSEATLLQDGRVLITGSDPQTPGLPEELRVEAYYPPYLTAGFRQPIFTITNIDWVYGGQYQINVQLFQGTTGTMKVSLLGAISSTHGNTMGARTLFPAFTCAGNTCTITAPPNSYVSPPSWYQLFVLDGPTPSHSHFVRIGGDPGQLGNWPQVSGFTTPGMGPATTAS
ncbi:copper radical oxidase [Lactarius quietus]|nr:copper radical oxidase [Lactarius quietus]